MSDKIRCFVAYPSSPPSLAETIEYAIEDIKGGGVVEIGGWKATSPGGKFIITTICEAILDSDLFICDLTNLNHNVLFELGYAIANKKRIYILIDLSIQQSKVDYEKFKLLTTIGYIPYSNTKDIVTNFYQDEPYNDLDASIYKEAIESVISKTDKQMLFYLKSGVETEASVKLSRRVNRATIPNIVDDPTEVPIQTLSWYAQKIFGAYAVIVHFLSSDHEGWKFHNAKNSFVSGLAYGFQKPLLMLAHEPYSSPIDYRDLLRVHKTASQCEDFANEWLEKWESSYNERAEAFKHHSEEIKAQRKLRNIAIGDPIAEQESDSIESYFIPTAAYEEALNAKQSIFVGRKGSGKTANLYRLAQALEKNLRNLVCIIKPVAYELEGILRMLKQSLPLSEKGYLIESLWKFLVYTELAKKVYEDLSQKPTYYQANDAENELVEFIWENSSIITPEFSIRLESAVNSLQKIRVDETGHDQRVKISELLHNNVITNVRSILGKILEKKRQVVILIDNLDKAWNQRAEFNVLSELLFGLLRISHVIEQDFRKSDYWRRPVNLSLIIFLRSDIFSHIMKYARERDKIPYTRLTWQDPELLIRVLEERFKANTDVTSTDEIWSRYFCRTVNGIPIKTYLTTHVLPRPRDLIYFTKVAIAQAVNRGHGSIEEKDILEGEKQYSQFALDSLLVENGIRIQKLEELLFEFVGGLDIIGHREILNAMRICGIPDEKIDDVIELLIDLTFIGVEVAPDQFEFVYNEEQKTKLQVMARKTAESRQDKSRCFLINKPFHAYLEIKSKS